MKENKKTRNERKLDIIRSEKDIKYRGILSYMSFKVLAYICLFLSQLGFVFLIAYLFNSNESTQITSNILTGFGPYALLLFLGANFCIIISSRQKIVERIIIYGILSLLVYGIIIFVYYRYILGYVNSVLKEYADAYSKAERFTKTLFGKLINYNVFVDLTLFSLFYFFILYKPKHIKSEKGILIFRLCSIIPAVIAIVSSLLTGFYALGYIYLPIEVLAILPCRSIKIYAIFFILTLLFKNRKNRLLNLGLTEEEYNRYLRTNKASLNVSLIASLVLVVVGLIDLVIVLLFPVLTNFKFGDSYLFILVPFVLLLSYSRKPRIKDSIETNLFFAIGLVIAVVIAYLELGLYILS